LKVEDFIQMIAQAVAAYQHQMPPRPVQVQRADTSGAKTPQTTSLPQLLAEWSDTARDHNLLLAELIQKQLKMNSLLDELVEALRENHSIAKKVLRANKKNAEEDD
jgi:hypothetical protein